MKNKKMSSDYISDFLNRAEMREVMAGSGSGGSGGTAGCPTLTCSHDRRIYAQCDQNGVQMGRGYDNIDCKPCFAALA